MNTLVWVRFTKLLLEMFKESTLLSMGNTIGKVVKVDMTTTDVARGMFARVCVEIDLDRPLLPSVMIMGRVVQVEYEGLTKMCFLCGRLDHKIETCPKSAPPETPETQPVRMEESRNEGQSGPYGPWMIPTHERRRPTSSHAKETTTGRYLPEIQPASLPGRWTETGEAIGWKDRWTKSGKSRSSSG